MPKEMSPLVRAICTAYESGYGHGFDIRSPMNPYADGSDEADAWHFGYRTGYLKKRDIEPSADPNPLDPTNNQFRLCLKGHVGYSRSFDECPSCKVERNALNR